MPFDTKPILVFWEITRACGLSCVHCRASAITEPLPGELSTEEGMRLIGQVEAFGKPYPTIILTGGDPLKRPDLFELMAHAADLGVTFAVSPAVTPLLDFETLERIRAAGASSISISLDGARPGTHDSIRGVEGTFERTLEALRGAVEVGLRPQVNTAVMHRNFGELPETLDLIRGLGVKTWELFFLVKVGRGVGVDDLSPQESETACNFLYDASFYGITIRTVEAPFIRRVATQRREVGSYWAHSGYHDFAARLLRLEGEPEHATSTISPRGTLDGDGIIFVAHDGAIHPGGLVPVQLGNVRRSSLSDVYRDDGLLLKIRRREFGGPCGICSYRDVCGGSRARAFAGGGNPLESDPACLMTQSP